MGNALIIKGANFANVALEQDDTVVSNVSLEYDKSEIGKYLDANGSIGTLQSSTTVILAYYNVEGSGKVKVSGRAGTNSSNLTITLCSVFDSNNSLISKYTPSGSMTNYKDYEFTIPDNAASLCISGNLTLILPSATVYAEEE